MSDAVQSTPKIQIIAGTTRPGRKSRAVADWVLEHAQTRTDAEFELVDIADYALPLLDEPLPPMMGQYSQEHTKRWSAKIAEADGFIFVTAEYNHGVPGSFKNALDFLYAEYVNKAVGFVSYGVDGGVRSVEQLRQIVANFDMADVREKVSLSMHEDFQNFADFVPRDFQAEQLGKTIDQVVAWTNALAPLRHA